MYILTPKQGLPITFVYNGSEWGVYKTTYIEDTSGEHDYLKESITEIFDK